ncbi:MAG TPA: site-2 protease family protein, partial [Candidatus Omnitrophota bacterium]|nr:site-2 protease family protein [Candidatus Omnitrophota bacterium]
SGKWFLLIAIYFNLGLAVFNLIPIPPLDGARVLTGLLPIRFAREYVRLERFGFWIILALVWFGAVWRVVIPLINFFCMLLGVPQIRLA